MSESNMSSIPPEVAAAFESAVITALQELTQVAAVPDPAVSETDLSGSVVLATIRLLRPVPGTMTLGLTAETAAQLAARYLPHGTQLSDEIVDDVAGEFANVIAGQAKTSLKGTPYHFTISIPVVTRPEGRENSSVVADMNPVVGLTSELGRFRLLVDLLPCPNA